MDACGVFLYGWRNELKTVTRWLDAYQRGIHASPLNIPSRIRVILILTSPTATYNANPQEVAVSGSDVAGEQWPTILVLDLRDRHQLLPSALYALLQRLLLNVIQGSQAERMQQGLFYLPSISISCGIHAFRRVSCAGPSAGLSPAREQPPVPVVFQNCFAELIREASKMESPSHYFYSIVASAVLIDRTLCGFVRGTRPACPHSVGYVNQAYSLAARNLQT